MTLAALQQAMQASGAREAAPALEAVSLAASRGGRRVLHGISLSLCRGEWVVIVGPNGAGKSTLLSLLAGLARPDSGSVRLLGKSLNEWSPRERARCLAWLSQQGEAEGDIPVRDVVRIGRLPRHGLFGALTADDEAAVDAALAEVECCGLASRRLSELSGGERQRVLLARALAVQAQLLLLDEPTTHLDAPHQRALVRSLAARARAGAAVAAVMHDLTLALAADRILVVAGGRLRADGSPGDAQVRDTLVEVFGRAFSIEPVVGNGGTRWAVLPAL